MNPTPPKNNNKTGDIEKNFPIDRDIHKYYHILEECGKGAFSVVFRAKDKKTGKIVAVKKIRRSHVKSDRIFREIEIMLLLNGHPNVLSLYDVFQNERNIFLVTEYASGGELFDQVVQNGEYSEKNASDIVRQLFSAISFCHEKGVAHRDLKPQNLLLKKKHSTHVLISDFGLSKIFSSSVMETCCGSPEYVAPEVLDCKPYHMSVDMWSMGIIIYILLTGCFPFFHEDRYKLFQMIQQTRFTWPKENNVSDQAKNFVSHLLRRNPEERPTATECLEHPWLVQAQDSELKKHPLGRVDSFSNLLPGPI